MYLYPDDLTARATLWLWTLRDMAPPRRRRHFSAVSVTGAV